MSAALFLMWIIGGLLVDYQGIIGFDKALE
jgi:hypothetical protein